MDETRFDQAARSLATGRRKALLGLLGLGVGAGLAIAGEAPAPAGAEVSTPEGICRIPNSPCGRDRQCCSRNCSSGACTCKRRGSNCFNIGITCCSGRCRRGRCT